VGILFALPCLSSRVPPSSIISLLAAGAGRWTMEVRRWTLEAGRCTGRLARWCGGGISDVSAAEAEIDPDYIANHLHHCKWGGGGDTTRQALASWGNTYRERHDDGQNVRVRYYTLLPYHYHAATVPRSMLVGATCQICISPPVLPRAFAPKSLACHANGCKRP
jgi:hypothetical protein